MNVSFSEKNYVSRNVARAHAPFLLAFGREAIESAAADVILGIGYENIARFGVNGYAVRDGNLLFGAVRTSIMPYDMAFDCE